MQTMQMSIEELNFSNSINHEEDNGEFCHKLQNSGVTTMMRTNSSNADHEEFIIQQSPYRSSDPRMIDRSKITKFEKTGELLKRMKRELSTQALQKASNKDSSKINDKLTTQHSYGQLRTNDKFGHWQKLQKDEMTEAIMDEYEKQILRLKAELEDVKEEKKQVRQTLDKQRKFYMTEMYNKELIIDEMQYEAQQLRGQIHKHVNLQQQFQQKIRLLEVQNAEYAYQLEGWINSSKENSQEMSAIYEQSEDFCGISAGISPKSSKRGSNQSKRGSNQIFMSLDGIAQANSFIDEDPYEIMRMAHDRQIQKYEKQLKNMKDYYESKLKTYRRSFTPQKPNPKNPIHIVDEYICSDTISSQSQSRPQNLRNMLRQQFNHTRSPKKVDDNASFATVKYFMYPINSKKNLNVSEIMLTQDNQCEQFELKCVDVVEDQRQKKHNKFKEFILNWLPSKQFVKGFGIGTVASGILALAVCRGLTRK